MKNTRLPLGSGSFFVWWASWIFPILSSFLSNQSNNNTNNNRHYFSTLYCSVYTGTRSPSSKGFRSSITHNKAMRGKWFVSWARFFQSHQSGGWVLLFYFHSQRNSQLFPCFSSLLFSISFPLFFSFQISGSTWGNHQLRLMRYDNVIGNLKSLASLHL